MESYSSISSRVQADADRSSQLRAEYDAAQRELRLREANAQIAARNLATTLVAQGCEPNLSVQLKEKVVIKKAGLFTDAKVESKVTSILARGWSLGEYHGGGECDINRQVLLTADGVVLGYPLRATLGGVMIVEGVYESTPFVVNYVQERERTEVPVAVLEEKLVVLASNNGLAINDDLTVVRR